MISKIGMDRFILGLNYYPEIWYKLLDTKFTARNWSICISILFPFLLETEFSPQFFPFTNQSGFKSSMKKTWFMNTQISGKPNILSIPIKLKMYLQSIPSCSLQPFHSWKPYPLQNYSNQIQRKCNIR